MTVAPLVCTCWHLNFSVGRTFDTFHLDALDPFLIGQGRYILCLTSVFIEKCGGCLKEKFIC